MATKTLVIVEWGEQKKLNVFTRNWVVSFYRHEPKNIEIKYLLLGPMRCGLMVFSVSVYCVLWNLMVRERVFTMDKKKTFIEFLLYACRMRKGGNNFCGVCIGRLLNRKAFIWRSNILFGSRESRRDMSICTFWTLCMVKSKIVSNYMHVNSNLCRQIA